MIMSDILKRINKLQTELNQLRREFDNSSEVSFIERNTLYSGALLFNNSTTCNRILFVDSLGRFFAFDLNGTNTRCATKIEGLPMLGIPITVGNCDYVFKKRLGAKTDDDD